MNKGKTLIKGTRQEKRKRTQVQTKDNTQKCKMHNVELQKEKLSNLDHKSITSSRKQVVQ